MHVGTAPVAREGIALPVWLGALAILVLTFAAYFPALRGGFVWDDDAYVTANPLLRASDGMWRIWFSLDSPSQYFPLTYTTFRIEHALWGLNPLGYHIVNVLLHVANALLVWRLLRLLSVPGAWLAATIFALHPVHVESVAWVTERKNVLSTFFYLTSLWSFLAFAWPPASPTVGTRPRWSLYVLSVMLYLMALFAKTTACTLPAAMLLILWWKRKPIDRRQLALISPFVIAGVAMGVVTILWERHHQGTMGQAFELPWLQRLLIACHAVWFYLGKLVWPADLSFSYPQWPILTHDPWQYIWLAACLGAGIGLWFSRRWGRGAVAAALFFAATLAPMLGFIPLYTFTYTFVADHYQYVASLGPIVVVAYFVRPGSRTGVLRLLVSGLILLLLGSLTWRQAHAYQDQGTLWRDTLDKSPSSWMAHNNYAAWLLAKHDHAGAREHIARTLELKPKHPQALINLARLYEEQGDAEQAIANLQLAIHEAPRYSEPHYQLAGLYFNLRQLPQAVVEYRKALELNGRHEAAHCELGMALELTEKPDEAVAEYRQVIRLNEASIRGRLGLANVLTRLNRWKEAAEHYAVVLKLDPNNPGAQRGLAAATEELRRRP